MKKLLLFVAAAAICAVAYGQLAPNSAIGKTGKDANPALVKQKGKKRAVNATPEGSIKYYQISCEGMYPFGSSLSAGPVEGVTELVFANDGKTVYIKNIVFPAASMYGDFWVSGELNDDGSKLTVPLGQTVFTYNDDSKLLLGWATSFYADYVLNESVDPTVTSVTFDINENGVMRLVEGGPGEESDESWASYCGTGLATVVEGVNDYAEIITWNTVLTPINVNPAVPADPTADMWYDSGDEGGLSRFGFTINLKDVDGNPILPNCVSYSLFTDDNQIVTFDKESYGEYNTICSEGDVVEIPYEYSDYDFSSSNVYFYRTNEGDNPLFYNRIGIQVYYTVDGVRNSSNIVYWNYPISDLFVTGSFNGWDTTEPVEMTPDEDHVIFTAEIDMRAGEEFKLISPSPVNSSIIRWYGGVDDDNVGYFEITKNLLGKELDLVDGSNFKVPVTSKYTLTANVEEMSLVVVCDYVEPEYYVSGTFNSWATDEALKMELQDDGTHVAVVTMEELQEFKIITPDASTESGWRWFGGEDENNVNYYEINDETVGIPIPLIDGKNFRVDMSSEYTLTLEEVFNEISDRPASDIAMASSVRSLLLTVTRLGSTGVKDLNVNEISNVKYVNLAGQVSDRPFDGMNIVVTRYSDGTTIVQKAIK